ncbi:carbohydrate ABC transporter permease [Ruminococcaceae bacterium OttesenSCG-928-L11]|nr:carbohydrate ABC transporter permease [Ruminococcaceae bacterium OttesenSCG-928-L11]
MTHTARKNKIRTKPSEKVFTVVNYIILISINIICLYPMLFVAFASFSNSNLLMQHSGLLIKPLGFNLEAYKRVFANPMIGQGYLNTLFILVVGVSLSVITTAIGAYALSRRGVMWNKALNMIIAFTMFFSGGMIPFYLNLQQLHLTGTRWGLIIPFLVSTYNLIILRTSFASIPESLFEAAYIDGAGHMRTLVQIVMPLSKAVLAVMVLYYGVSIWNGWFWASTILRDRSMYPLQVILREILLQNSAGEMATGTATGDTEAIAESIKYATIMVATVPILCVYPFIQKHFEKGVMIGAVKE